MKKIALAALALILAAPAAQVLADGSFYMLTGKVGKVVCEPSPNSTTDRDGKVDLVCELAVLPAPDFEPRINVFCLDPKVALACNTLQEDDPVLIVGDETGRLKRVEHVGLWLDGAF